MDNRTTAAVGGIGVLAFTLVGVGLWHVAGVLDSMTKSNVTVAMQTASTTAAEGTTTAKATSAPVLPRVPQRVGTGSANTPAVPEKTVSAPLVVAGVGSLNNLLALKSDLACAIQTVNAVPVRSGTVYLSGSKLRANVTTLVHGTKVHASMIEDGQYLYAWREGDTSGVRLLAASSASGSAVVSYGGVNPVQELRYRCNVWKSNAAAFLPPSALTFTDSAGN